MKDKINSNAQELRDIAKKLRDNSDDALAVKNMATEIVNVAVSLECIFEKIHEDNEMAIHDG